VKNNAAQELRANLEEDNINIVALTETLLKQIQPDSFGLSCYTSLRWDWMEGSWEITSTFEVVFRLRNSMQSNGRY
jgi:hypothetical protein